MTDRVALSRAHADDAVTAVTAPLRSGADTPEARETRTRIVEAAERLFRVYGYQKTTVADIAGELGMSPANVYRFFASKAAINELVATELTGRVQRLARAIVEGDGGATARLARLVRTIHVHNREQLLGDRKMHDMVEAAMDESWGVIQAHIDEMEAIFGTLVADGAARGEFSVPDPVLAGKCVFGACVAFFHPQLIQQCLRASNEEELEGMIRFVVRGLGGDPAQVPVA